MSVVTLLFELTKSSFTQNTHSDINGKRGPSGMVIVLVEQYFEFAHDLASTYILMVCEQDVMSSTGEEIIKEDVHHYFKFYA